MDNYADLLFVDAVRALQEQDGTAEKYANLYPKRTKASLEDSDREFIESRESFYIASVSSTGWPYLQHRGGPKGFLKVIGDNELGFIDYPGNRQYVTMGHTARDARVALFLMDYERRARLKLLGTMNMQKTSDVDDELCKRLATPGQARPDRIATIDVVAMDWNCPQYIPQWYSEHTVKAALDAAVTPLTQEIERLKVELAGLTRD